MGKWSYEEEKMICDFYLNHLDNWCLHIRELINKLKNTDFPKRRESSLKSRISNYVYLRTGQGSNRVSKQSELVYKELTRKERIF